jgi:hypothetical protein
MPHRGWSSLIPLIFCRLWIPYFAAGLRRAPKQRTISKSMKGLNRAGGHFCRLI